LGTPFGVAITVHADALGAGVAFLAAHSDAAGIDTIPEEAEQTILTKNAVAGVVHAQAGDTSQGVAGTLVVDARLRTAAVDADRFPRTEGRFVDLTVTVIVEAVAHFHFGHGDRALGLAPIYAANHAIAALSTARSSQPLVHHAIAVVVDGVEHLVRGWRRITRAILPRFTGLGTASTEGETGPRNRFVDLSVAVIVRLVALLGTRLAGATIDPASGFTDGDACTTDRFTHLTERLVDQTVAIVVDVVAALGLGWPDVAAHELPVHAAIEPHPAYADTFAHDTFIEAAIAVVVQAIADLVRWRRRIANPENAICTGFHPLSAEV
jgi:hypothetical protein